MENEFPIVVFWSKEDRTYIAVVPDLRGCTAHGATPENATAEARTAMRLWLDVAREHGDPIPTPSPPSRFLVAS